MKKENISEILSGLDESYITEASDIKKRKAPVIRYIGAAACLTLATAAGIILSNTDFTIPKNTEETTVFAQEENLGNNLTEIIPAVSGNAPGSAGGKNESGEEITIPALETATGTEMMILPKWEDRITGEKFTEVKIGDITYSSQVHEIPEDSILAFLRDAEISGYDNYEDKIYTEKAKIYSIKHINTDCAVAVQIGDDKTYYVFINVFYEPETLGDFINDLDLKNTLVFRKAYVDTYEYSELSTSHSRLIYADFDDSIIWDMLLSDISVKNTEYNHPYNRIDVETDLPVLGYKNISFSVTTDGFIITNILNTQKCFFVGKEKTDAFSEYIKNNVAFKEQTEVYEINRDGVIPGKGEDDAGQAVPPYNPNETVSTPSYNPDAPVENSPTYNPSEEVIFSPFIPGSDFSAENSVSSGNTEEIAPVPPDFIVEMTTEIP